MKEILEAKLKQAFAPSQLEVQNLSHLHQGHEHVGANSHFHIVMVSQKFEGKPRVERYRMVHQTLAKEITESLHAISCNLKSPQEASSSDAKLSAKSSVATANMPPDASTDSSESVGSANPSGSSDSDPSVGDSDSSSSAGGSDSDPSAGGSDSDPSVGGSDSDPSVGGSDSKPSGKTGGGSTAKGGAGDEI